MYGGFRTADAKNRYGRFSQRRRENRVTEWEFSVSAAFINNKGGFLIQCSQQFGMC